MPDPGCDAHYWAEISGYISQDPLVSQNLWDEYVWDDLQAAVQQWLVMNAKFKSLVAAQSHKAGSLSGSARIPKKEWVG